MMLSGDIWIVIGENFGDWLFIVIEIYLISNSISLDYN